MDVSGPQPETRFRSPLIRLSADEVKSAAREQSAFVIRATQGGKVIELRARAVIDATRTWNRPNPLGANGLPAIHQPVEALDQVIHIAEGAGL